MSYINTILTKHEKKVMRAKPHWIYVLEGILWLSAFILGGIYMDKLIYLYGGGRAEIYDLYPSAIMPLFQYFTPVALLFFIAGAYFFLSLLIEFLTSEITLTNKRIIYKHGLIVVDIEEADLKEIRAEHIDHGILGFILGYAHIRLDCRFVDDIELPAIVKPLKLVKAMQMLREKDPEDEIMEELEAL